jgi:hypothetical protein
MEEDLVLASSGSPVWFKCITVYLKCNQWLKLTNSIIYILPYISDYKITFIFKCRKMDKNACNSTISRKTDIWQLWHIQNISKVAIIKFSLPQKSSHTIYPILYFWSSYIIASGSTFEVHFITVRIPPHAKLYVQNLYYHQQKKNGVWSRNILTQYSMDMRAIPQLPDVA